MNNKLNFIYTIVIISFLILLITIGYSALNQYSEVTMIDLKNKTLEEVKMFAKNNKLELVINKEYSDDVEKDSIIDQSIKKGSTIKNNQELVITISLGDIKEEVYEKYKVNELGRVPIMMYHGIHNIKSDDTGYTGGNIDKAGYQRTNEAFRKDLLFYYEENYRMIRLKDYINGTIDVEVGKSPIVLTFDDGLKNNIKVTGLDKNGNIIIDPNCAVGILEEFKKNYPDFNVTATFFLNGSLFQQPEYNDKILKWLIDNRYDIGNHSYGHTNFVDINIEQSQMEIGRMYQMLNNIIPNDYVKIVSLPFGSPYKKEHPNFMYIKNGEYNNLKYTTEAILRVGWESDTSPYSKNFDKYFLKRIRAYDNNGFEFDIQMNFKNLDKIKYISDGDKDTVVIPNENAKYLNSDINLEIIKY